MTDGELLATENFAGVLVKAGRRDGGDAGKIILSLVAEVRRLRVARYSHEEQLGEYRRRIEAPTLEELKSLSETLYPSQSVGLTEGRSASLGEMQRGLNLPPAPVPSDADAPTVVESGR